MSTETDTVLIIGVGNEFRRDDGAGLAAARRLASLEMAGIAVIQLSGDGSELLAAWKGRSRVIAIDAVSSGAPPGNIHRLRAEWLTGDGDIASLSSHGVGLTEAVRLAAAMGELPPEFVIYGVEGKNFDYGLGLSPEVQRAVDQLVKMIIEEMRCTSMALPRI